MKKAIFLISCLLISGCEFGIYPRPYRHSPAVPVSTVATEVVEWCEFQPFPYHEAPGVVYRPVTCDAYCCVWAFQTHTSVCEEYWCNYNDSCGWELEQEICYIR